MRIALSSYTAMGAWWVLRLMAEGHKVDYYLSEDKYEDVLGGLIPPPKMLSLDHRKHQGGYGFPSYEKYDLSLFDLTGRAKQADHSSSVCPTLGDGSFEHLLEDDREFGIKCMEECGINVPPYTRFDNPSQAKSFLKKENKRFVFKPFTIGGTTQDTATTYVSKGPDDMIEFIDRLWIAAKQAPFILQEFVAGTEIGTEAFFNGSDFYLLTGTLEEKKFMNDNKGPNTGCAGNTIFAMNQDAKIYKEGLLKARPMLQAAGFRGIIDLNTIVTEDKMYGLEWTPRFGYLCCPSIASMYGKGYGELLYDIASGKSPTIRWSAKYAAAATITIPPYPTEMRIAKTKRTPIGGIDPEDIEELQNTYLFDAMMEKDKLVTSGNYGYIGALITTGNSIDEAFGALDRRLKKIDIPNCQYRTDLKKVGEDKYNFLLDKGWI